MVDTDDPFTAFIYHHIYDIKGRLLSQLDALRENLYSEEEDVRTRASDEISKILDFLYPPCPPLTDGERLRMVAEIMADQKLSDSQRLAAVNRAGTASGRPRGRPRDETSQYAIHALTLHMSEDLSWREIAWRVKGCKHKGSQPATLSCKPCAASMLKASDRLEEFLNLNGYHSGWPHRKDLDAMSNVELERFFDRLRCHT